MTWQIVALVFTAAAFAIAWRSLDLYRARCEITQCRIHVEASRAEMQQLRKTVEVAIANVTAEVKAELAKTHNAIASTAADKLRMQRRI